MNYKVQLTTLRQNFAQCVFTHQVQEAAANRNFKRARTYKKVSIGLVAGVLLMLVLQSNYHGFGWYTAIGSGLAIGEIIFLIIQLSFDVEQKAVQHKNSALQYMVLRDQHLSLITDIHSRKIEERIFLPKRDHLLEQYQTVSKMSPQTEFEDYQQAQKVLGLGSDNEQYTWSDKEIDRFLPKELRTVK